MSLLCKEEDHISGHPASLEQCCGSTSSVGMATLLTHHPQTFFGKVKGEQGAQVETMEVRHSLNLQWCHIVGSAFTIPIVILIPQQKYRFLIVLVTSNKTDIEQHHCTDIFRIPVPSLQSLNCIHFEETA